MKNMAWLSLVSERLRYTKVSQSSGLPADNSELMSRSKFTRDIGGGSANKDILGKNSERASQARSRFSSPQQRTNEPRARGRKAAERKGPRGERGARSIADGGRRYRPSGFFGRPLFVHRQSLNRSRASFRLRVSAKLGQKRPFLPRSSRLLPPSHAAAASSVLKLPTTTEGV